MSEAKVVVIGSSAAGLAARELLGNTCDVVIVDEVENVDPDLMELVNLELNGLMSADKMRKMVFEEPIERSHRHWNHLNRPDNWHPSNPRKRK